MKSRFFVTSVNTYVGRRAAGWLPWLVVALVAAALLWPTTTTASRLVFQSDLPTPEPIPTDTPEPPPTDTPVPPPPPTDTPVPPPPPTDTPVPPPTEAEAVPTDTPVPPPTQAEAPAPTQVLTPTPGAPTSTPTRTPMPPAPTRRTGLDQQPQAQAQPGSSRSIVNWSKFWDTVTVAVAYPWLCCGIGLLLLVPVVLLYLEIKGRRRPVSTPEAVQPRSPKPGKKRR